MQNTSTEFKTEIKKTGRTFYPKVVIGGKEYTGLNGFKISSGTNSSDVITFGDSVSSYLECTIQEVPDTDHLENKIAVAYIGLQLSKSIEWIKMGTFTVSEAKRDDKVVKIHADDNMLKCEKGFFTDLKGNQSITTILNEQCKKVGITFVGGADSASVNIDGLLGMTIREVIGILASFCGKNAVMNRDGNLKFVWYDDSALKISADSFADPLNINETDTLINRVRCTIDKDKEVNVGTGMGIEFSNPLMTEAQLQAIAKRVIGFKYRACDLNFNVGRPDIDAGDIVTVIDKRGNNYVVPIMDLSYECDGGVWNKVKSKAKTETAKANESKGPMTQMIERTYSDLTVTKKLIADTIDVFEGNFETINTNYITVSGKITAVEGGFELLQADNAVFKTTVTGKLSAYDADIVNLKASYGKIDILDVDLARINTLLSGSITSGSTQTIVLNAQNTTIANALIKNAMIDSLAAGKITAGIIDASSIHLKSKSGNMDIYDNTISIRDANRVRVQIGKDASSDYNIYVWDKVGKLMFDASGLKADGIKDKIIRDDMVSETANINGSKLNITSVVTEINNGTSNIKSSHITYDPTGQSLDVAFNSLTSKIDDMEIGGRNLLRNSSSVSLYNSDTPTFSKRESGKVTMLLQKSSFGNFYDFVRDKHLLESVPSLTSTIGTIYAFSVDVKCTGMIDISEVYFAIDFREPQQISSTVTLRKEDCEGKWFRLKGSLLKIVSRNGSNCLIRGVFKEFPVGSTIEYKNFKLERGNKSTDWTPAPEDIEDKVTSLSTSLTVEQGRINALITSDTTIKGDLTKVQSNYTSIKATVTGLSTTVGQHTSSIQTVTDGLNNMEIGGRNLLLKSGTKVTNSNYMLKDYILGDLKPNVGDLCTVTLKGSLGKGKTSMSVFNSGGSVVLVSFLPADFKDGVATKSFKWRKTNSTGEIIASDKYLSFYMMQSSVVVDSTIEWARLDFGNKAPLVWSPAPEDIDASIKIVSDKQTAFDVSIAGITGRVTKTETNITTISGNVTALTTRVSTAETKITDSAIVSTVTKSSNWSTLNSTATTANTNASSALTKANTLIDLTTVKDTRNANSNPQWYFTNYPKKTVKEFKFCTVIGITGEGTYGTLITEVSWSEPSGGYPNQLFYPNNSQNIYRRVGISTTAWGVWTKVAGTHNIVSSINQTAEAIKISANKIQLEGIVTANENFKVLLDGSIEAKSGKFGSWTINKITGSIESISTDDVSGMLKIRAHQITPAEGSTAGVKIDASSFKMDTAMGGNDGVDIHAVRNSAMSVGDMRVGLTSGISYVRMNIGDITGGVGLFTSGVIKADQEIIGGGLRTTGTTNTGTIYSSNWFRSTGNSGWYSETHGGGIYMVDSTWLRVYNSKKLYVENNNGDAILTSGGVKAQVLEAPNIYATNVWAIDLLGNSVKSRGGNLNLNAKYGGGGIVIECASGTGIEIYTQSPFIDFHHGATTSDFTSRLLATSNGTIFAYSSIVNASDRRYKKDFKPLDDRYLSALRDFKPVLYHFIKNDNLLNIGLIAQEVEETLIKYGITDMPIISKNGLDDKWCLDYAQVGTLAVYGWQQHEAEIASLKLKIQMLEMRS